MWWKYPAGGGLWELASYEEIFEMHPRDRPADFFFVKIEGDPYAEAPGFPLEVLRRAGIV